MKNIIKEIADQDTEEKRQLLEKVKSRCEQTLSPKRRLLTEYADRKIYSHDLASIPPLLEKMLFRTTPLIVIQPDTPGDLLKILEIAAEFGLPVFPRGIASWGLGGAVPTLNGIVVDFSPMSEIFAPDLEDKSLTVQAGARWGLIDERLRPQNLQMAVTPSSRFSTVGGWIATGGFGLGSLGYGHLSGWVKELKVATPAKGLVTLRPGDEDFPIFFHTEGQLGLIYEVTLKLIPRGGKEYPHLLHFESIEAAFDWAGHSIDSGIIPTSMNFKSAHHMRELNQLWNEGLFREQASLLLVFNDRSREEQFREKFTGQNEAPGHLARPLWQERFNPLSMHSTGPSLLASEVILPIKTAPPYVKRAERLGRDFRISPSFEFHFIKTDKKYRVLAMCLFNCDRRKIVPYCAYLLLVSALTRLRIRMGGRPYGLGIWNAPFYAAAFEKELSLKIVQGKKKYDPAGLMNPRKFSSIHSRFHDIPATIFNPLFFSVGIDIATSLSPLIGLFLPSPRHGTAEETLEDSAFSCTGCGNCIAVCPAYLITGKESTSPRGKLSLARRFIHGKKLSPQAVQEAFFCTRCRNCERVCQSKIRHTSNWDEFEEKLTHLGYHSEEKTKEFVDSLPEHKEYLDLIGFEKWVNL